VIAVLHPFGKDIGYKPHVHAMVTEGGFSKQGEYFSIGKYINYHALHRRWQYRILKALKPHIHKSTIDLAYRKYPNSSCAYVKPERINSRKRLIEYIERYLRHPAIADSGIDYYDGKIVEFWYKDANEEIQRVKMFVDDFIGAVIQHIPEKHEKLFRYYGAYSRIKRRPLFKQLTITNEILGYPVRKRVIPCSKCKEKMQVIAYMIKPAPKDVEDLKKWLDVVS
jgi:hypothetical protein